MLVDPTIEEGQVRESGSAVMLSREGEQRRIGQARAWLERIRALGAHRRSLEAALADQLEAAANLRGLSYSERVATSPRHDAIADAVIAHMELAESLEVLTLSASERITDAAMRLSQLDDSTEAAVLTWYYITGLASWSDVAERMGYTRDGIMKLARRATLHAYDVMPYIERDRVPLAY